MRLLVKISVLVILIISFGISCEKEEEPIVPVIYNQEGEIGPDGGIVETDDGAYIEIPEGALTSKITISITNITDEDTSINVGYKKYKIEPNGLTFSDSVIISLPFDKEYLNLGIDEENNGIGIMVFQDSMWFKLHAEVDLENGIAKAKTTHFSNYAIRYPGKWTYYYINNKSGTSKIWSVPFYTQGSSYWCAYYSLSMILKYAGYPYKAPFLAALFNEPEYGDYAGMKYYEFVQLDRKLGDLGIEIKLTEVPFISERELSGYILYELNNGYPVYITSQSIMHAIVVTGHDQTGFYINDPSGYFLQQAIPDFPNGNNANPMIHVTYKEFRDALNNIWDLVGSSSLLFSPVAGESTLIIKSSGFESKEGLTLNFYPGPNCIGIWDPMEGGGAEPVGELNINGKYKPDGYMITDWAGRQVGFDGSNDLLVLPIITNSDINEDKTVRRCVKIDGNYIFDGPDIIPKASYRVKNPIKKQLSNLLKGNHEVIVELRSDDSKILYDHWEFNFEIENEYFPSNEIPIDGLVVYFPFNGDANDLSSNGNHGTVHGPTPTEDRFGNANSAYLFDGVNDYIEIDHSPSLDIDQYISISFWIKFESSGPYYMPYHIIEKGTDWGCGQREDDINSTVATNTGSFNVWTHNFDYNKYYHFVIVYDGSKISTYVNGQYRESVSATGQINTNTYKVYISRYYLGGDYYFDGTLDDFRIYNRPLNDNEISALYHEGGY